MGFHAILGLVLLALTAVSPIRGQSATGLPGLPELETSNENSATVQPVTELYAMVMTDAIFNSGRIDPDWADVMRPSKLPSSDQELGRDGSTDFSVRQTRFGMKSFFPTTKGQIRSIFELDLFGVGDDAGQTTFRLRHAYVEYGRFGAGQFDSPFMDMDVFPSSQEYWGPSGMALFRNVQLRYIPVRSERHHVAIALERPGGSGDAGKYDDVIEERGITLRFPLPDLSAEYRHSAAWGYVEIAGIVRRIEWDDRVPDDIDLSGQATGWGLNLSTNLNLGPEGYVLRASILYGEGIEGYMNDATADIAIVEDLGNPLRPLRGEPIPVTGLSAFYDLAWSEHWTSTAGYSFFDLDYDGTAALANTFVRGQYALANLQYHPTATLMTGVELQWLDRENFSDGFSYDSFRVQVSVRYKYGVRLGGSS